MRLVAIFLCGWCILSLSVKYKLENSTAVPVTYASVNKLGFSQNINLTTCDLTSKRLIIVKNGFI